MAPERWTSDEQLKFLKEHLPTYSEHSRNNTLHLFWPDIFSEWATKWPEIRVLVDAGELPDDAKLPSPEDATNGTAFVWTDVYTEIYQDALYLRKKASNYKSRYNCGSEANDASYMQRIREWMSNNRRKALGLSSMESSVPSLLAENIGARSRGHQLREVYQRMYKEALDAAVEEELKASPNPNPAPSKAKKRAGKGKEKSNASPPTIIIDPSAPQMTDKGYKLKVRQAVVKRMWEEEGEDVKEAVRLERDKRNSARELVPPTEGKKGLERDPDDRQRSLNALGPKIAKLLQEIYDLCGWSALAILVGPNPGTGENLSAKTFSYAHDTAASATFPNVYANFNDSYLTPYIEWLKTVYPKHLRGGKKNVPVTQLSTEDESLSGALDAAPAEQSEESGLLAMDDESDRDLEELYFPSSSQPPPMQDNDQNFQPLTPSSMPGALRSAWSSPPPPAQDIDHLSNPPTPSPIPGPSKSITAHTHPMPQAAPEPSPPACPPAHSAVSILTAPVVVHTNDSESDQATIPSVTSPSPSQRAEGSETPISGPMQPPGGPTEHISAAFVRMGQTYLPVLDSQSAPTHAHAVTASAQQPGITTPDVPIDPALLNNHEDQTQPRPHLINFGSVGLPRPRESTENGGVGGRGRGRGGRGRGRGGRGRGRGRGGAASGGDGTGAHANDGDLAPVSVETQMQGDNPSAPDCLEIGEGSRTGTQCTLPSRAARARVKELNDAWKAESMNKAGTSKGAGRGKKAKPHLFNPDGPTPLVVLPPLNVPARDLAAERPQRERRPPKRFDGTFDLPVIKTKRPLDPAPAEHASGSEKRARKK